MKSFRKDADLPPRTDLIRSLRVDLTRIRPFGQVRWLQQFCLVLDGAGERMAAERAAGYRDRFPTFNFATRLNSRTLIVARAASRFRAWAAINR